MQLYQTNRNVTAELSDCRRTHNNVRAKVSKLGKSWRRSSVLQPIHMLDKWTEYLESGGQIDAVYTYFEKAFNKVPHKSLLSI